MSNRQSDGLDRRQFIAAGAAFGAIGPIASGTESSATSEESEEHREPGVDAETIAHAQKLAALDFDHSEREAIARNIGRTVDGFRQRRKAITLPNGVGPMSAFDPRVPGVHIPAIESRFTRSPHDPGSLPSSDEDIAFAPVASLSRWIERRELSSRRLTEIYLERLKRLGPKLECVITLTEDLARAQARTADSELASGRYRGPLHGIPWGAKDLFDTAGIPTTWGAAPYKNRVPDADATVVQRLAEAGAVLVAKTTLGALAYGDRWFGGRTRSPWNLERGSSGSSAGSASATAAGLVGFSLGTETYGSIVSPSMRCGTTGLRPTFGRVPRTGAMALCWSLDKIGPITRSVEDAALVLDAISGADGGDPCSIEAPFNYDGAASPRGLRVGYSPAWFQGERASAIDRRALEVARSTGIELVEIELPDWPYDFLLTILHVEAAAAFEELTLSDRDDELVWQADAAWPNTFRGTWFVPAVELMQAERFRRQVCEMMAECFRKLDAIIGPSFAGGMLLITNNTGHPSLTIRAGFDESGEPRGFTIWGRLFDEGTICTLGAAMERELGVSTQRPPVG